jgi:hypothetical protein
VRFRKKPIVIEAIQFDGTANSVYSMCREWPNSFHHSHDFDGTSLMIYTLEGEHKASMYDFVIKGVEGEFYPCKPDIFEKSYEAVND